MTRLLFFGEGKAITLLEDAAPPDELVRAINNGRKRVVFPVGNGPWWAMRYGDVVVVTSGGEALIGHIPVLNRQERLVLQYLAEGLLVREIGPRLGVSRQTVGNLRRALLRKLQVSTTMQLVSRAVALGLYRPSLPE